MPETPRSTKRRRLNPSSGPASIERSTRRSARSQATDHDGGHDDMVDVIAAVASPVHSVDEIRASTNSKKTPSRQYSKKGPQTEKEGEGLKLRTPTKSQARPQRTLRIISNAQDNTPSRSGRRKRVAETSDDAEDELALPEDDVVDELDAAPATPGLSQKRSGRTSGKRMNGIAPKDAAALNVTPTRSSKKKGRRKEPVPRSEEQVEDEGTAMDVDQDELEQAVTTNGCHATSNGLEAHNDAAEPAPAQLRALKSIALSKLSQRRPIPLRHLDAEYARVHQLLHATVTAGESNSLLLIGARGSGKTALIDAALRDLARSQKDHFHTVRLSGFVQTDDKLALREIWRQLGREMDVADAEDAAGGGGGGGKSYADTLTMLLALLSHPDEIAGARTDRSSVAKSVVFVMDEFDLFATHARQTLLYNLLDIAQSRKAPIAVIGLTTRIDVTEALEKRVKSRFSHRYVHLPSLKTLSAFVDVGKAAVQIHAEELTFEERVVLLGETLTNGSTPSTKKSNDRPRVSIIQDWNDAVETLFTSSTFLQTYVNPVYYTTKSVPALLSGLLVAISSVTTLPDLSHFVGNADNNVLAPPDSHLHILPALSELALSLLIAACRLSVIHSTDTTNFPLAHAEYVSLASKARINSAASGALASGAGARMFGKEVARRQWEKLISYGLLVPVASGAFGLGAINTGTGKITEMVRIDVALEEIPLSVEMNTIMEKWCSQI